MIMGRPMASWLIPRAGEGGHLGERIGLLEKIQIVAGTHDASLSVGTYIPEIGQRLGLFQAGGQFPPGAEEAVQGGVDSDAQG
jgi:hypothetical protein